MTTSCFPESCQTRQCDLQEFFRHENQSAPACLNEKGRLYTCQKSQLTEILQTQVDVTGRHPAGDTFIIDGSCIVNIEPWRHIKTVPKMAFFQGRNPMHLNTKGMTSYLIYTRFLVWNQKLEWARDQIRVYSSSKTPTNWRWHSSKVESYTSKYQRVDIMIYARSLVSNQK